MLNSQNEISSLSSTYSMKIFSGSNLDIEGVPSWFPKAFLSKTQSDLIAISPEGEKILFVDYFTNFDPPSILTENGLLFKGSLIDTLSGSFAKGQYVQAAEAGALSIGEVSSITGEAKAIRLDGTTVNLASGDPVFQGDTIETSGSGAVGLVFLDKTTLSLSEGGKMVLDELVYDPATGTGSMAVDMVEGAFSFVSGEIAKSGPDAMQVSTPVATIGIRGTTVAGKAAVEGNENSFTLLQDADGGVGQISVSNAGGTQVLAQVGATTSIASFSAPPPPPIILSAAQIQANYGTALNVLPPTPVVAPTPQVAPPPEEQQQQEEVTEEEATEDETTEEEVTTEEGAGEESEEGPPEGEEGLPEGEEGPPEGEEGPPEGEEGPPVGPDGEPLAEGEISPEGEEGPPVGPDGEPLAEGEGGPPVGPDGEPLAEGEGAPPLGPDGEPLPPGEGDQPIGSDGEPLARGDFGPGGPPIGLDGEPLPPGEGEPPIGPDGEPLAPGDFGPGGPSPEQDAAAREAFETALAAGLSPEEAMAEAAAAAGFPAPPGGFGEDPLANTAGGADFAGDSPFGGPGGPGDFGPGGPGDFGSGGPGDFGSGGPGDFGPGGPGDFGPGGPGDFGPGGPGDFGPGGPGDFGPGGPGDFGLGGPGDFGLGGPGDFGTGGPGDFGSAGIVGGPLIPGGPGGPGGPGDFGPAGIIGSPLIPGGPGDPGDPGGLGGPVGFDPGGPIGGSSSSLPGTFQPPGSFQPPGTIQQPGAYNPGLQGFSPIMLVTTAPVPGSQTGGFSQPGDVFHSFSHGDEQASDGPGGGPDGDFGATGIGPLGAMDPSFGAGAMGPGDPMMGGFGGPMMGGFGGPMMGGFGGGFDPYASDPYGGAIYEFYDPSFDDPESGEDPGSEGESGGSGTTFIGDNNVDNVDKSSENVSWRFEGYSGADIFKGGSADDIFWGAVGADTLTGNGGRDVFYFGDFTEGTDTVVDFVVGNTGDILKFGSAFTGAYTRDATVVSDAGANGSTYNMASNSNVLPKIFNFTTSFSNSNTTTGVKNQLTSFKITTDGSIPISNATDFILVTGSASPTTTNIFAWSDSGNGVIDNGELFGLATLSSADNDNITAANFAFGTI